MNSLKTLNNDITDVFSKLSEDNKLLSQIRKKVLEYIILLTSRDQNIVKRHGLDHYWESIEATLAQAQKQKNKNIESPNLTLKDNIDVFSAVLNSLITGEINESKVDDVMENFINYEKECSRIVLNLQSEELKDDVLISLFNNIRRLLGYYIKYKKAEVLIHKMSAHQFLLKSFKFQNVFEALQSIIEKDDNVERKLYLIEKTFDVYYILIFRVSNSS